MKSGSPLATVQTWFSNPSRARLLGLGLALFFLGAFIKLTWELQEDTEVLTRDQAALLWIADHRVPAWNGAVVDITALGSVSVLTILTTLGLLAFGLRRDWPSCLSLGLGSAGAGIITYFLKHFFSRPRPEIVPHLVEVQGYAYPSGHSLAATACYFMFMFLAWRFYPRWSQRLILLIATLLLVTGIALSRLYLGVHYPSDVLSGILLGTSWSCFVIGLFFHKVALVR